MTIDANSTGREIEQATFEETLAAKIAWLLTEGEGTTLDVAKYLIDTGSVADPAEAERLKVDFETKSVVHQCCEDVQVLTAERDRLAKVVAAVEDASPELIDRLGKTAFDSDDLGGHHTARGPFVYNPYSWESIPEDGRQNYRRLIRDVLIELRAALASATDAPQPDAEMEPEEKPTRCRCGGIPPNHHPRCDPLAPEVQGPPAPPWPPPPGRMHG